MPIPVRAYDERLRPVLQPVKEILGDGEPESHGRAVDDAVHDAGELDRAGPPAHEVGDEEDDEQGQTFGGFLDDGR